MMLGEIGSSSVARAHSLTLSTRRAFQVYECFNMSGTNIRESSKIPHFILYMSKKKKHIRIVELQEI